MDDIKYFFENLWPVLLILAITLCCLFSPPSIQALANKQEFTGTVIKTYIDDGDTYFVIQKNGETTNLPYQNEDNIFYKKFNSGNYLVEIEIGKTYKFTTVGWRIPFFSAFPNIVKFEEI